MMAGRQLPFVSLIVPAWLVVTMSGWRGLRSVWPAVLVCGGTFAVVQFAWSNYVGVELVDIAGGLASIAALGRVLPRVAAGGRVGVGGRGAAAVARSAFAAPLRRDTRSRRSADARAIASRVDAVGVSQRRGHRLGARAGEGVPEPGRARARVARSRCCTGWSSATIRS